MQILCFNQNMIIKFTVGNFLSFKENQTFSFVAKKKDTSHKDFVIKTQKDNFVRVAAIYGANASGKSNFTKAFAFLRTFVLNGLKQLENLAIPVEPFLLSNETEGKPSFFELEILIDKETFIYGFEASNQKVFKEWLYQYPNRKVLFDRRNDIINSQGEHF